jgi:alpha-tubulin suppressor-like RCC1 family protein
MKRLVVLLAVVACARHHDHVDVASGPMSTCALVDGAVQCWGDAGAGMLGTDDLTSGPPRRLANISDATQITVGLSSACALRRDHTLVCWGIDWAHATAARTRALPSPTPLAGLTDVVQVSAGRSHVCAVTGDGGVACWGDNGAAQCGQPFTSVASTITTPTRVPSIRDAVEVSAGSEHTCVRHRDGGVSCFGRMQLPKTKECPHGPGEACVESYQPGELENATIGADVPHRIEGVRDATQLAGGDQFSCALTKTGEVYCWGANTLGELGTADATPHEGAVRANLHDIVAIRASSSWNACALTKAGEVWCWGALAAGTGAKGPARVDHIGKASAIAVGDTFACAVTGATIHCWEGQGVRDPKPPYEIRL